MRLSSSTQKMALLRKMFFNVGWLIKAFILVTVMQRYQERASTIQASRALPQPLLNSPKHKPNKKFSKTNPTMNTIDTSNLKDLHIKFQPQTAVVEKTSPGVGDYNISTPIVKPSYETYEKSEQVILVKINHIGGTSSFRSEGERFIEGNSIYASSPAPGPGTYCLPARTNRKPLPTYHQSYDLIQELMRNSRERTESMPNYQIGVGKSGLEYNGLPKHLQEMYNSLHKERKEPSFAKSLPLERLIKLRKRAERLPIVQTKKDEQNKREDQMLTSPKRRPVLDKMNETLQRLDQQLKIDEKKAEKIRAIMKPTHSRTSTTRYRTPEAVHGRVSKQGTFNKNMVNMLFELTKR